MVIMRRYKLLAVTILTLVIGSYIASPAPAQNEAGPQNQYVQGSAGGQAYNSPPNYAAQGQPQQGYPQSYGAQQFPGAQYQQLAGTYTGNNQNYPPGNNSQQFYSQPTGSKQVPGQFGGGQQYGWQPQNQQGGYSNAPPQSGYQQQQPSSPIYGYAADVQYAQGQQQQPQQQSYGQPQYGQQPPQYGAQIQQQPQYGQQQPAPAIGYQQPSQNNGGLGLQQTAGAYFDQLDKEGAGSGKSSAPESGGGSKLGGKLAQGAKALAGVAVPAATGYFMTQAANKQARRLGIPSGGMFGNNYGYGGYGGYGGYPGGLGGYGSPFGGLGGGGGLMNGLGSLLGR